MKLRSAALPWDLNVPDAGPPPAYRPALPTFPWAALGIIVDMRRQVDEEGCGAVLGELVDTMDQFDLIPPALNGEFNRRAKDLL